jgi:hypothetical protein
MSIVYDKKLLKETAKAVNQFAKFLNKNTLISWNALEKKCKMPQGCIYKIVNKRILMPPRHVPVLFNELVKYGFEFDEEINRELLGL